MKNEKKTFFFASLLLEQKKRKRVVLYSITAACTPEDWGQQVRLPWH